MSDKLDVVLKQVEKKYGAGTIIRGDQYPDMARFSSGIFSLDVEIGGGIPRGRVLILTGNESAGKSTVASRIVASAQSLCRDCGAVLMPNDNGELSCFDCDAVEQSFRVFWCDTEGSFDPAWLRALGGDAHDLYLFQPEFAEQAVDVIEAVIRTGDVDIVVIDSIAMMSPVVEIEKSAEDSIVGSHAKLVNRLMRAIQAGFNSLGAENPRKPTVLLVNQIREKIGVMYGSPDTMPGGRGQTFASSITVKFFARPSERIVESGGEKKVVGQKIRFNVEKNKTFPPGGAGMFSLYTDDSDELGVDKGTIDNTLSVFEYGVRYGVIDKAGAWYRFAIDEQVIEGQGKDKFLQQLDDEPEAMSEIAKRVQSIMRGNLA